MKPGKEPPDSQSTRPMGTPMQSGTRENGKADLCDLATDRQRAWNVTYRKALAVSGAEGSPGASCSSDVADCVEQEFAIRRMDFVDCLPQGLRECVHEFGLPIVKAFLDHGVSSPKSIRHLVGTIFAESSNLGLNNFVDKSMMDKRAAVWLEGGGYLVVPKMPTPEMVTASINALDDTGIAHTNVPRSRKHTVRLICANVAGHIGGKLPEGR